MDTPSWVHWTEGLKNFAEMLAILVGGGWAFFRFVLRRERETALSMDMKSSSIPRGPGVHLVSFDVELSNKAAVSLRAKRKRLPAYPDPTDVLNYSVDLLLRSIPSSLPVGASLRWFPEPAQKSPQPGDIEVDLVDEYEDMGKTDFWMEPGETYHVSTSMVLAAGTYLAMVTFVGNRSDKEFWRRVFVVQVPTPSQPSQPTQSAVVPASVG